MRLGESLALGFMLILALVLAGSKPHIRSIV